MRQPGMKIEAMTLVSLIVLSQLVLVSQFVFEVLICLPTNKISLVVHLSGQTQGSQQWQVPVIYL